jgi:hypothetical protein
MAPDLRNHNFVNRRFEHGARHKVMKREIRKRLGIGPMVTTYNHMESGDIKKGMHVLGNWKLRLFGEMMVAIKFEVRLVVDLDGPFHKFKYRDILNRVE